MDNRALAKKLTDQAHLLETRKESLFRIIAYRQAAETVLGLEEPVENIFARLGRKGLQELPGIGRHLSYTIESLIHEPASVDA
jgi:DNA polymerase/3'-5' exonuclease PolX